MEIRWVTETVKNKSNTTWRNRKTKKDLQDFLLQEQDRNTKLEQEWSHIRGQAKDIESRLSDRSISENIHISSDNETRQIGLHRPPQNPTGKSVKLKGRSLKKKVSQPAQPKSKPWKVACSLNFKGLAIPKHILNVLNGHAEQSKQSVQSNIYSKDFDEEEHPDIYSEDFDDEEQSKNFSKNLYADDTNLCEHANSWECVSDHVSDVEILAETPIQEHSFMFRPPQKTARNSQQSYNQTPSLYEPNDHSPLLMYSGSSNDNSPFGLFNDQNQSPVPQPPIE